MEVSDAEVDIGNSCYCFSRLNSKFLFEGRSRFLFTNLVSTYRMIPFLEF